MFARGETEPRKDLQSELEMDIQTLIFGNGCSVASPCGQTPDARSYQSLLTSHLPPCRVRHCSQIKTIFSGPYGPSFKRSMKRYLNGRNEPSWEVGGRWLHPDNGVQ